MSDAQTAEDVNAYVAATEAMEQFLEYFDWMQEFIAKFPDHARTLRTTRGLNTSQLAEALGVHQPTVSNVESRLRPRPPSQRLVLGYIARTHPNRGLRRKALRRLGLNEEGA